MPHLKLHRDEPEQEPPAPLPFTRPDRSWRSAGEDGIDSIKRVENALADVESKFDELQRLADETEPLRMSDWIDDDDDGPWAA
ncbi:MAG: hypothetical protein ACF8K1_00810 [Phycisphaerales bacterium JB047]